ncbi:hypothetical protein NQ314_002705 [Rhamnusium bicolor]|uniref:DUF5641 domain-containing protein n=1 Tax=Rhamnusium bicolor TaxID=1586634 RepID=A0AAV8ZSC3_9CUCU|nr:hypothetical protein NQ314_002705 [Rhamnusium bicolor]
MNNTENKKGDVVLIANDNCKRLDWPLAIVQDLLPGKDGEVRLVRLKTAGGTMLRSIQRLCLIETTALESKNIFKIDVDVNTKEKKETETRVESEDSNRTDLRSKTNKKR